jgi:hypothetical protein
MATGDWGLSPLGNLEQFPVPQFQTGHGLAEILRLKQRQQEQIQESLAGAAQGIAQQMQQRKKDEMANALADQAASYYGIDVPRGEGLGSGELRLKMMDDLFRAKQAGLKAPLEQDLLRARIARSQREPSGRGGGRGGGGGAAAATAGMETIWHNGIEYRKKCYGQRLGTNKDRGRRGTGRGRRSRSRRRCGIVQEIRTETRGTYRCHEGRAFKLIDGRGYACA